MKCFATHGFDRKEVDDVWFNTKLGIMMNKKKATAQIEQAFREILLEAICDFVKKVG